MNFLRILAPALVATSLASAYPSSWALLWSDEFSTDGLPDSASWSYESGGGGWGNSELEYYTRARIENASVANGALSITARKEAYQGSNYTSARLVSKSKHDWLYGHIEVRAKLPRGVGMWPAIWLMPTNSEYGSWPASGEMDIMENVGFDSLRDYSTIHTSAFNHTIGTAKGSSVALADLYDTWHVYAQDWYPDSVVFWVDSTHIFSFANDHVDYTHWPFDKTFFLILNVAIGGAWGGQHGVDTTMFPASMLVDYVRVYGPAQPAQLAPPAAGELVWNGDFSFGLQHWEPLGAYGGAVASASVVNGECKVEVSTAGTADWGVQFDQVAMAFDSGKTYVMTFQARSSVARPMTARINQNVAPFGPYALTHFDLTTAMQAFTYEFTMTKADPAARLELDFGTDVSTVYLDNVSVHEKGVVVNALIPRAKELQATAPHLSFDLQKGRVVVSDGMGRICGLDGRE